MDRGEENIFFEGARDGAGSTGCTSVACRRRPGDDAAVVQRRAVFAVRRAVDNLSAPRGLLVGALAGGALAFGLGSFASAPVAYAGAGALLVGMAALAAPDARRARAVLAAGGAGVGLRGGGERVVAALGRRLGVMATTGPAATAPAMSASAPTSAHLTPPVALPAELRVNAVVIPESDPDEARADVASAIKPPGDSGLSEAHAIRLTADATVWRLWSGPNRKDASGRTNRLGGWWSFYPPHGTQQSYRVDYGICRAWNDLTWVAKCTLKKGAVVAIGPSNSVSAEACGDETGKESYPAQPRNWQVWISRAAARPQELECPPETADYEVDPQEISRPKRGALVPQ